MPYCAKCGADLPPNAAFCSKCGAPVSGGAAPAAPAPPTYGYGYRYEKQEKREKETRQAEKYEKREKQQDRSGPLIGGAILILLGIIFYASITYPTVGANFWAYFLFGLGIILIVQSVYRFSTMKHRAAGMGSLWGGIILIAIGATGIAGSSNFWPVILIVIGVMIIIAGYTARSRTPNP